MSLLRVQEALPVKTAVAFFDGGCRAKSVKGGHKVGHHACAVILSIDGGEPLKRARFLGPKGTSNQAEAGGLILALEMAAELGVTHLRIRSDSKLIVEQALGNWGIHDPVLRELHAKARKLSAGFKLVEIDHVRRARNSLADELVGELLDEIVGRPRKMSASGSGQ